MRNSSCIFMMALATGIIQVVAASPEGEGSGVTNSAPAQAAPPAPPQNFKADGRGPPFRQGQWSLGAALIVKAESYRGMEDRILPIPFVSYRGRRLEWFGPSASYTLHETDYFSLAGIARYTFDGYRQGDSAVFEGMPDRDATLEAGFRAGWTLAPRWRLDAGATYDLLGRHEGIRAGLALRRTWQSGKLILTPELAMEWMDDAVAGYYYGVQRPFARADRPAYAPDDAWEPRLACTVLYRIGEKWTGSLRAAARWLPKELTDSPLVEDRQELTMFWSVSRRL